MVLSDVLQRDCTQIDLAAGSKKRALELASELLSSHFPECNESDLLDALMARERLGSTGVGEGIAIPHCRFEACPAPTAAVLRLQNPIDFDALDSAPVDLLFVLVVPSEENEAHLKLLATVAGALNQPDYRDALRAAETDAALFDCAVQSS